MKEVVDTGDEENRSFIGHMTFYCANPSKIPSRFSDNCIRCMFDCPYVIITVVCRHVRDH